MTWEDGSGEETTAKKVITFRGDDQKRSSDFFKKNKGDTHQLLPWVTATLVTPLQCIADSTGHRRSQGVQWVHLHPPGR